MRAFHIFFRREFYFLGLLFFGQLFSIWLVSNLVDMNNPLWWLICGLISFFLFGCGVQILRLLYDRPLQNILNKLIKNVSGDLSIKFSSTRYEAHSLRQIQEKLNLLIRQIKEIIIPLKGSSSSVTYSMQTLMDAVNNTKDSTTSLTDAIHTISNFVSYQSLHISKNVEVIEKVIHATGIVALEIENQTESVDSSFIAVNELAKNIESLTVTATEGQSIAMDLRENADRGGKAVARAIQAIQLIDQSSSRIFDIVKLIGNVADKTNILAMNATIEAANAGKYGQGFSVVAQEIRKLATSSRQNSQEISNILQHIIEQIGTAVVLAEDSGIELDRIIKSVNTIDSINHKINEAIRAQNENASQIMKQITNLKEISDHVFNISKVQENDIHTISTALNQLRELTAEIVDSVAEQRDDTESILKALQHVDQLTYDNKLSIEFIDELLSRFRPGEIEPPPGIELTVRDIHSKEE